ncbi:MAG: hypothetical protein KF690_10460, partial [Bacteroidetes bacterium]|nr:hypothetical protein [Bacteroidota bacterium]
MRPGFLLMNILLCCGLWAAQAGVAQHARFQLHAGVQVERPAVYQPPTGNGHTLLHMAYASADITNATAWQPAGCVPTRLTLVYTAYPADTANWIIPYDRLTRQRLANLYQLEPRLRTLPLVLVEQTAPRNGKQAQRYFHGALIDWVPADSIASRADTVAGYIPPLDTVFTLDEFVLPEDKLSEQTVDARMEEVRGIIAGEVALKDPAVLNVLSRHPKWTDLMVVMDWTGSMHPYGGQLLRWMSERLHEGAVRHLVLFNDGDDYLYEGETPIGLRKKPLGETGGIYFVQPDNLDQVLA